MAILDFLKRKSSRTYGTVIQRGFKQAVWTPKDYSKLAEAGFMGLCVPEEYGGAGTDFLSYVLVLEEISRVDAGVGVTLAVHTSAGTLPIVEYGDEEQRARYVPALARGEKIGCFALTEANTGSDAAAIEARAEKVEGGYRVSGQKQWITNGRVAGTMVLFARVEGGASDGVTAFVVPTDAEGLSFGDHARKMALEPAPYRLLAGADDLRYLRRGQVSLGGQQDHLGARPQPNVAGGAVQLLQSVELLRVEGWDTDRFHGHLLRP